MSLFVDNAKKVLYTYNIILPLKGANILVTKLNVIMKYNRTKPVWVCPDCDTENDLSTENCFTCDHTKPSYARIITPESERQEMEESVTVVNPPYTAQPSGLGSTITPPIHYPSTYVPPKKGTSAGVIIAIIFIILVILGVIGFAVAYDEGYINRGAFYNTVDSQAYDDILTEYTNTI